MNDYQKNMDTVGLRRQYQRCRGKVFVEGFWKIFCKIPSVVFQIIKDFYEMFRQNIFLVFCLRNSFNRSQTIPSKSHVHRSSSVRPSNRMSKISLEGLLYIEIFRKPSVFARRSVFLSMQEYRSSTVYVIPWFKKNSKKVIHSQKFLRRPSFY